FAAGGGPAAGPAAAAEGRRRRRGVLLGGVARQPRRRIRGPPSAVPGRAGVRLHHQGRRRPTRPGDLSSALRTGVVFLRWPRFCVEGCRSRRPTALSAISKAVTDVNSTGDGKQRLLAPPTAARCPGRFGPPAGYPYPPSPYTATVVVTYELTVCEAQTTTRRSNAVLAHRAARSAQQRP